MPPIVSVVGRANSGKTSLLKKLIAELKRRGYRVAVVKHAGEDFDIDVAGKDSWHFRQAGSDTVAISSPRQLAIIQKLTRDLSPQEIWRTLDGNYDLLLTEGFKQASTHKIEVHRKEQGTELVSNPEQLLAVVTDEPLEIAVPLFSADDTARIADLLEAEVLRKRPAEEVELYVNDSFITLNPFVKKILANILVGFATSLKGITRATSIRVSLRRERDS